MLRITVSLMIAAGACSSSQLNAQDRQPKPSTLSADEVRASIERVDQEIGEGEEAFSKTPQAKKISELWNAKELRAREHADTNNAVRTEIERLEGAPEVKATLQLLRELRKQRSDLVDQHYAHAYQEGIARARLNHQELTRFAVTTPELQAIRLTVLTFPRIDGSTSTQPLAALIACHTFGAPRAWVSRDQPERPNDLFGLHGSEWPEVQLAEYKLIATGETIAANRVAGIINTMLATNASTHDAYLNVIEGRSDIGLICRQPSTDETAAAKKAGVELDITPVARDAFVFIVNEKNAVANLTTAEIRKLYSSKDPAPFHAYQRSENSGSQELMKSLVMKGTPLYTPTGKYQGPPLAHESMMSSVFLKLTSDEAGLAYSVWYYEQFMIGSARTKMIGVDGVQPTFETIQQGAYPYVAPVMFVCRKRLAADSPTMKLRQWLLSAEGQAVVKQSGYVPVK